MNTTFGELKNKEVINIIDGARLGHVCDIVFDNNYGKVCGLIVPGSVNTFSFFKKSANSIYIPYNQICKIGEDVILVELFISNTKIKTLKNSSVYNSYISQTQTINNETPENKPLNN